MRIIYIRVHRGRSRAYKGPPKAQEHCDDDVGHRFHNQSPGNVDHRTLMSQFVNIRVIMGEPMDQRHQKTASADSLGSRGGNRGHIRRFRSFELLQGDSRILIDHGDDSYTLRVTRNGKLILTK